MKENDRNIWMRIFIFCSLITSFSQIIGAALTERPIDQPVYTTETVSFQCGTNLPHTRVRWTHLYDGGLTPSDVFANGILQNGYAARYVVDISTSQRFDLVIRDVRKSDAGLYTCIDDEGQGDRANAKLTVRVGYKDLLVTPVDTAVIAGQDVILNCSSAYYKNVRWMKSKVGSPTQDPVYYGYDGFVNGYKDGGRHSVDADDVTGTYNLRIKNVKMSDAGRYICVDMAGLGKQASAELIVLATSPSCTSNFPPDGVIVADIEFCGIRRDNISRSCRVDFSGNRAPIVEWKRGGDVIHSIVTENTTSIFEVTLSSMSSQNIINDVYCQTILHGRSHTSCRTTGNKQIYLSNVTDLLELNSPSIKNCSAETNQKCNYSWIHIDKRQQQRTFFIGPQMNLSHSGEYICQADCLVRGRSCTVYPLKIDFQNQIGQDGNRKWGWWLFLVLPVLLAVFVIISILYYRKKRKAQGKLYQLVIGAQIFGGKDTPTVLRSLTLSKNYIYAVFQDCDTIFVFNSSPPCCCIANIRIEGMNTPEDIVSFETEKENHLYVSDSSNHCIWKVKFEYGNPRSQLFNVSKFIENTSSAVNLSITRGGTIIGVRDRIEDRPSAIELYDVDGNLSKTIELRGVKDSIKHAVLLGNDTFIVSFGGCIGKIDKNGDILSTYPARNDPAFDTRTPLYVVLDGEENIFAAEYENKRVAILDGEMKEMEFVQIKSHSTTDYLPKFISNNKYLFIAQLDGKLEILDLPKIKQPAENDEHGIRLFPRTPSKDREAAELSERCAFLEKQLKEKEEEIRRLRGQRCTPDSGFNEC